MTKKYDIVTIACCSGSVYTLRLSKSLSVLLLILWLIPYTPATEIVLTYADKFVSIPDGIFINDWHECNKLNDDGSLSTRINLLLEIRGKLSSTDINQYTLSIKAKEGNDSPLIYRFNETAILNSIEVCKSDEVRICSSLMCDPFNTLDYSCGSDSHYGALMCNISLNSKFEYNQSIFIEYTIPSFVKEKTGGLFSRIVEEKEIAIGSFCGYTHRFKCNNLYKELSIPPRFSLESDIKEVCDFNPLFVTNDYVCSHFRGSGQFETTHKDITLIDKKAQRLINIITILVGFLGIVSINKIFGLFGCIKRRLIRKPSVSIKQLTHKVLFDLSLGRDYTEFQVNLLVDVDVNLKIDVFDNNQLILSDSINVNKTRDILSFRIDQTLKKDLECKIQVTDKEDNKLLQKKFISIYQEK